MWTQMRARVLTGSCLLAMLVGGMGLVGCGHDHDDDRSRQSGYYDNGRQSGYHDRGYNSDYDRNHGDYYRGDYDRR